MTVSQKAAISLLISVLLFVGFSLLSFAGFLDFIEARFYNPSVISSFSNNLREDALSIDNFLNGEQERFSAVLSEPSVKNSFMPNQSQEDIITRSAIIGTLQESVPGLQWIRFIDTNGIRIHFSTYIRDIVQQDNITITEGAVRLKQCHCYSEVAVRTQSLGYKAQF